MENVEIKISRNGEVIKSLTRGDVIKGLVSGDLLNTDHFWAPGMKEWGSLKDFRADQDDVAPAPPKARVRKSYITPRQEAYLKFLGVVPPSGITSEEAGKLIDDLHDKGVSREGWSFQRLILHPGLYEQELSLYLDDELPTEFKAYVRTQVIDSTEKLTKATIVKVFESLEAGNPRWWHSEDRLEVAYQELKRIKPSCCDGQPVRDFGDLVESLHSFVRSRVVGCSAVLTKSKVVSVIQALCSKDPDWMKKPGRNELFWSELSRMHPACCDGRPPSGPKPDEARPVGVSSAPRNLTWTVQPGDDPNEVIPPSPVKSSGCLLVILVAGFVFGAIKGIYLSQSPATKITASLRLSPGGKESL